MTSTLQKVIKLLLKLRRRFTFDVSLHAARSNHTRLVCHSLSPPYFRRSHSWNSKCILYLIYYNPPLTLMTNARPLLGFKTTLPKTFP